MISSILLGAGLLILVGGSAYWTWRRARHGSGCCAVTEKPDARVRVRDRNRAHYPYRVKAQVGGMTCANCARKVENALNAQDGIWATVDLNARTAQILTRQAPDVHALQEAVREAGYVLMYPEVHES